MVYYVLLVIYSKCIILWIMCHRPPWLMLYINILILKLGRYFVVVIVWCNVYKTKIFNHLPTNVLLDCIHTYIFNWTKTFVTCNNSNVQTNCILTMFKNDLRYFFCFWTRFLTTIVRLKSIVVISNIWN